MPPLKTSWLSDNIKPICALLVVTGVLAYLFMVTLISADNTVRSQALISIVTLGTAVTSYYFGYSQGASKKDEAAASVLANSPDKPIVTNAETVNVTQPENPVNTNVP